MLAALLFTAVTANLSFAQGGSSICEPSEKDAAQLSCHCIRARKKSTVYIKGKRLPYVNSIAYCSDRAQPTLVWIPKTADIVNCPVVDCHEPEDP